MTHTLLNPQVDRSKPVEAQDKDSPRGSSGRPTPALSSTAPAWFRPLRLFNDILVMPSTFLATNEAAAAVRLRLQHPGRDGGPKFICRPSVVHQNAGSAMDYPLLVAPRRG